MRKESVKCDWCGLVKEKGMVYVFGLRGEHGSTVSGFSYSSYRLGGSDWDICPSCKRKLMNFIKQLRGSVTK
jgi:hypothetical protein